jgi:transcriptional regulator with GAF, ATPase, and Fis domain
MINWDEFEHIHVIKKLKQILNSWWNIDVVFTDERGQLRGNDQKNGFCNPAVATFLSKETSVASLGEVVSKTLEEVRQSGNRYMIKKWETAGFDMAIIPITIENDFMGCVVAMGFMKDRQQVSRISEVRERMAIFGASGDTIDKAIGKISFIDDQDREHFLELVELVAQEVVTLHLEITTRENRIKELNKELGSRYKYDNMIGKSKPMQTLYGLLDKIKGADSTVLIQGENGTGKELIAKAIHYNSNRKEKPFIIQNCSASTTTFWNRNSSVT